MMPSRPLRLGIARSYHGAAIIRSGLGGIHFDHQIDVGWLRSCGIVGDDLDPKCLTCPDLAEVHHFNARGAPAGGVLLVQLSTKAAQIESLSIGPAGGKILFAGGFGAVDSSGIILASTELFDPAATSFAPANQTPTTNIPRWPSTATLLTSGSNAGKVLIAGGFGNSDGLASVATELYDPATNSFAPPNQTASMNVGRSWATATVLTTGPNAGKVLIAGGIDPTSSSLASTELYDPATNSFAPANQTASMNTARERASATVLTTGPNAGKVLIAGGSALVSTELYDPLTNSFAPTNQTASMNSARDNGPTTTLITVGPNAGKILIAGGFARPPLAFLPLASTELYDPATNSFAPSGQTASMNSGRDRATATVIATGPNAGKVLIAGGITNGPGSGNFFVTSSTELYDPVLNVFLPRAQTVVMNTARLDATAVTVMTGPNAGKILIVGGSNSGNTLGSSELYDPATNSFSPAGQTPVMNVSRAAALAVQLPDTGPSPISFVGIGPLADNRSQVSALALGVPSGIQSGDVMLAQILIYDGNGTNVPTPPAGWSVIRHDAINGGGNQMTSWLYYKVAGSSEPGSYSWHISQQYAAGVVRAWRGASVSSPIDQSSGSTGGGFNPISVSAPSLSPVTNNELQVYFYGAQAFKAPTITEPSAITERLNEMSALEGFTTAFGDLAAPAGGIASPTYVAMASSNIPNGAPPVMTAQAVLLVPLNAAPTPTATAPSRTSTPTVVASPGPTPPVTPTPIPPSPPPPTPATPTATPTITMVRFVASGALTDSAQPLTSVTVSLPPNVVSGDLLVAQIAVWDGSGSNVPIAPAGWTIIRYDSVSNANKITSWLYYKVAGGSEPASYSWHIAAQYAAGVMGAWRGASSSSPIDQSSGGICQEFRV